MLAQIARAERRMDQLAQLGHTRRTSSTVAPRPALGCDFLERLGQVTAVIEGIDQVLGDLAPALVEVDDRQFVDQGFRQALGRGGRVLHRLELLVAVVVVLGPPALAEVAVVALELLEHVLDLRWIHVLARRVDHRLGGARLVVALDRLDHFEERVLGQFLLDALGEIEGGQLQDLHRLDHLRRLDQSLLHARGLVEAEFQAVVEGIVGDRM